VQVQEWQTAFKHCMSIKWHEHYACVIYSLLIIYVSINIHYLDLHAFHAENGLGFFFDLLDNTPTFDD